MMGQFKRYGLKKYGCKLGHLWAVVLLLGLLFSSPALATGVNELPLVSAAEPLWVVDQGDVISPLNEGKLGRSLDDLAQETGVNVHFVTIHRLDYGETTESFAADLFAHWFPELVDQTNQVVVVLDTVTNGTALVAGDQVQARLPEAIATSISQETMRIPLKDGNYNQAVLDGSARLETVLRGEPDPGPPLIRDVVVEKTYKSVDETDDRSATIIVVVLLIAATVIPMITYYFYQGSS